MGRVCSGVGLGAPAEEVQPKRPGLVEGRRPLHGLVRAKLRGHGQRACQPLGIQGMLVFHQSAKDGICLPGCKGTHPCGCANTVSGAHTCEQLLSVPLTVSLNAGMSCVKRRRQAYEGRTVA